MSETQPIQPKRGRGRPPLSREGRAENISIRMSPEDLRTLSGVRHSLGWCSPSEAVRHALRIYLKEVNEEIRKNRKRC